MENKDQYNPTSTGVDGGVHQPPPSSGVVKPPNGLSALSLETTAVDSSVVTDVNELSRPRRFARYAKKLSIALTVLVVLAGAATLFFVTRNKANTASFANRFESVKLPLGDVIASQQLNLPTAAAVTINGTLQLNNGLMITPSLQPTGAKAGQIYYDQGTNQLAYFNGTNFIFLTGPQETPGGVQSLGGATGALTLGEGLTLNNNQLSTIPNGVISVQGEEGDVTFTAGPGIVINGTTFSNSGVLSVKAGTPNVSIGDDGSGGVTISVAEPTMGTGTVTSAGGTAGTIPVFTADQNIEDSIITQSGLTVTISGDLSVITGGLSLSNALTVSNGGTGTDSLALNGILVGQGTGPIGAVAAPSAGLCLISTSGMPTWGVCPGGGGVTTLNGLNGALNIANASAAGSTITIDDASTSNKGIASFNGTNFTVTGGAVNTVQDINSSATPTFAGVNTNTITPNAALTMGVSAQTALLQGSTTTITSNGAGNNIVLNSAGTIELQGTTNVTGSLNTSGNLAVNGGNITSTGALNITPGGALTVGVASQTLTLQGGASTSFRATSGGNTTVVGFTNPVANTTLNFPALAAGTYTVCTTSGNCASAAVTLQGAYNNSSSPEIVLDATRGALTIRDSSSPIGGNLLEVQNNSGSATYLAVTSSGAAITGTATVSGDINSTTGSLQTGNTTRIDNSGNAVNIGSLTLSGGISGGTSFTGSGNINTTGGNIQTNGTTRIDNSGNLLNIASITTSGNASFQGGNASLGTTSQVGNLTMSDGSSNTGTLQVAALGQNTTYTLPDPGTTTATICLSSGNCAGSGGGVTTGGGTTNKLAKFTGTQAIGDSSITDDATNVTVAVDVVVQGGDLTVGSTSQPASIVLHDGNGQTTTFQAGNSAGNLNFVLPTNSGTANQCLKQSGVGNQLVWQDCDGGSGGSSATLQTAYNNSTTPEITLNNSVGGLTIRDNSTPIGGNLFEIQNNLGSTTYLAVTASGANITGTATATGNINTTGGNIQTNGTTRVDNSGNAVNIGNITGSGAMTIASVGVGNNITIDGANNFVVQDASVFNALTTFNANLDIGANSIVGTTGNISLTNFGVNGTDGSVTAGNITAGTYNGQTISNAANFTGTIAAAGTITTSANLAVNGGNITSTGALNITPGGTLTVGATGQQLVLQGSANTQLTATGSGFTTTVGFTGTPTGNVTYNFDRAAATGTYNICTTIGNCAGSGGGVTTTGGTTGTIAVFTGSQTLGDSLLAQSGGTVTVNGNLNLTSGNQFRVNGTQISSANLSNDANLAKLSASQTFTGNTVAFQNAVNSTNAFNVQNAGGNRILSVDSSNAQVVLGTASALNGQLVFMNVSNGNTVTIAPGAITGNRTLTLPDASGIICTDSGNCAGAGATLQTAYNFSVGGTTPKIKINSTLGGMDIQDADTPTGVNLLNIRQSNGAGLGSVMFGVGNTGQVTLQNSANSTAAFRLLTQGGTSILTGDTTNGQIIVGQSNTLNGTFVFKNASNANTITLTSPSATTNRTINLPDADGTICLTSGNCSGSGSSNTLQAAYDAGNTITSSNNRNVYFTMADTATDSNFLVNLECTTSCGSNGRFAVQNAGTDVLSVAPNSGSILAKNTTNSLTAFQIQNATGGVLFNADTTNGRVGIGNAAPGYALDVTGDINSSTALKVGGVTVCTVSGCTATGNYVQLQGSTPGTPQTGNLNISGTAISGTALQSPIAYSNTLDTISGTTTLNIGTTNATSGINLNQNVTLASSKTLTVQGTSSFRTPTDSTTALQVMNSGSSKVFVVDTVNNLVRVVTGSITNITTASGTGALQIGADNTDNLAFDDNEIMARSNGSAGGLYLQKLGGTLNIQATSTLVKPNSNSTSAFQVQNAAGTSTALDVDTTNGRVGVGTAAPSTVFHVATNSTQVTTPMSLLEQAGTGDATLQFKNATTSFYAGVDTSNAGAFTINSSTAAGNATPNAISHVQNRASTFSGSTGATSTTLAFNSNNTAGNTIVVAATWDITNSTTVICSDSQGNSYSSAIIVTDVTNTQGVAVCYAPNIKVGANTVTVSYGGPSVAYRMIGIHEYSGVATSSPFDGSSTNQATGTTGADGYTTGAATTSANGDLIFGAMFNDGSVTTLSAGTGFSQRINQSQFVTEDMTQATAGSKAATFTGAAARPYIAAMVALKASTTAGPITDTNTNALFTLSQTGAAKYQNNSNSTTAFQIQNSGGTALFNVDSTNSRVIIGNGTTGSSSPTLLVLNTGTSSDPTGVAGAMYYNSSLGKFRCYEGSAWKNCITSSADIARYRVDGTQNVPSGTDTKIAFSIADSTTSNVSVTGSNTFTINKAGIWTISGNVRLFNTGGGAGERYAAIIDGAGPLSNGNRYAQASVYPNGGTTGTLSMTTTRRFNAGDTISVGAYQTSGANSLVDNSWGASNISLTFIGD